MIPHIMGIDPGFRATGWLVADVTATGPRYRACGLIRTKKSTKKVLVSHDDAECIRHLVRTLHERIKHFAPRALAIETPVGSKSQKAVKCMSSAYTLCIALAELHQLPIVLLSADQAKKAVTGRKGASKAEVARGVERLCPPSELAGYPRTLREHITDAAALVRAAWDGDVVRMLRGEVRSMVGAAGDSPAGEATRWKGGRGTVEPKREAADGRGAVGRGLQHPPGEEPGPAAQAQEFP